jgi:hypothetical protein
MGIAIGGIVFDEINRGLTISRHGTGTFLINPTIRVKEDTFFIYLRRQFLRAPGRECPRTMIFLACSPLKESISVISTP